MCFSSILVIGSGSVSVLISSLDFVSSSELISSWSVSKFIKSCSDFFSNSCFSWILSLISGPLCSLLCWFRTLIFVTKFNSSFFNFDWFSIIGFISSSDGILLISWEIFSNSSPNSLIKFTFLSISFFSKTKFWFSNKFNSSWFKLTSSFSSSSSLSYSLSCLRILVKGFFSTTI